MSGYFEELAMIKSPPRKPQPPISSNFCVISLQVPEKLDVFEISDFHVDNMKIRSTPGSQKDVLF
jgi:hypothetical protein